MVGGAFLGLLGSRVRLTAYPDPDSILPTAVGKVIFD